VADRSGPHRLLIGASSAVARQWRFRDHENSPGRRRRRAANRVIVATN
jgi:hypothetical protein